MAAELMPCSCWLPLLESCQSSWEMQNSLHAEQATQLKLTLYSRLSSRQSTSSSCVLVSHLKLAHSRSSARQPPLQSSGSLHTGPEMRYQASHIHQQRPRVPLKAAPHSKNLCICRSFQLLLRFQYTTLRIPEHRPQVRGAQLAQPIVLRCLLVNALASRLRRVARLLLRQARGLLPAALGRLVL